MSNDLSIIETAHALADRGIYVHPLKADKTPHTRWSTEASIDHDRIEDWWKEWPHAHLGIATGKSGLLVLDVDVKHGKTGFASLADLEATHGPLPSTIVAETRSGGKHFYFRGESCNSVGKLRPGLNIRSIGGYVMAPPSVGYRWVDQSLLDDEPAGVPAWLVQEANQERRSMQGGNTAIEPIPEGSRNDMLFRMACGWRGQGMDTEIILTALEGINARRCQPPLDQSELETIASSVDRYPAGDRRMRELKSGGESSMDNSWLTEGMRRMGDLISGPELTREYIIEDMIPAGWSGTIYGPGGIGKSALLNELAVSLALGRPFFGHNVPKPRRVALISIEMDETELYRRFQALHEQRYASLPFDQFVATLSENVFYHCVETLKGHGRIDLMAHQRELTALIENNGIEFLVFDTFSRVHTAEENSNSEMAQVVDAMRMLSDTTGATIAAIHHVSKMSRATGGQLAARGASTLRDSLQWSYALEHHPKDKDGWSGVLRLRHDKGNFTAKVDDIWLKRGPGGCLIQIDGAEADNLVRRHRGDVVDEREQADIAKLKATMQRLWDKGEHPSPTKVWRETPGIGREKGPRLIELMDARFEVIKLSAAELNSDGSKGEILLQSTPENLATWRPDKRIED